MPKLTRFSAPAGLRDASPGDWSARIVAAISPYLSGHPQFYDPTKVDTPPNAQQPMLSWAAFPAALRIETGSKLQSWKLADRDRSLQDEYCEWTVERNSSRKITRITFTTEVPEYWEHLAATDPDRLVGLYREFVDPRAKLSHLLDRQGNYLRQNRWNNSRPGCLAHLMQANNTLLAAIDLIARATIPRIKNGEPVINQQELVRCAGLGNPLRNSDPQIASAINIAAREGNSITLADPPGLHLGRPLTAGMVTPDGADAARFWRIDRGDAEHTLRARFEVPAARRYVVGDIKIDGQPISFGGQVADRVPVWVKAVVKKGNRKPRPRPCGG